MMTLYDMFEHMNPTLKNESYNGYLIFCHLRYKNKFEVYRDLIVENSFLNKTDMSNYVELFYVFQKTILAFKKFITICYNKYNLKLAAQEFDLYYTKELSSYNTNQKVHFIETNRIYEFYAADIVKIICYSLLYNEELFASPQKPKNPHTNVVISRVNLYNIYFQLLDNKYMIPDIIHWYYRSDFTISIFMIKYETNLRDINVFKYYNEQTTAIKYGAILDMIADNQRLVPQLSIHKSFPIKKVLEVFEPILPQYAISLWSYSPSKKVLAKTKVRRFLKDFYKDNKKFGRMIYKINRE